MERWTVGARSLAGRRGGRSACDGIRPARRASGGSAAVLRGAAEELLDGVLGRDRVDRQPGPDLEPRDLPQARVNFPVPVVRGLDLFAERRGVEDEVVGRSVEAGGELGKDLAEGLRRGLDVTRGRSSEVGVVLARDDPDLERRA